MGKGSVRKFREVVAVTGTEVLATKAVGLMGKTMSTGPMNGLFGVHPVFVSSIDGKKILGLVLSRETRVVTPDGSSLYVAQKCVVKQISPVDLLASLTLVKDTQLQLSFLRSLMNYTKFCEQKDETTNLTKQAVNQLVKSVSGNQYITVMKAAMNGKADISAESLTVSKFETIIMQSVYDYSHLAQKEYIYEMNREATKALTDDEVEAKAYLGSFLTDIRSFTSKYAKDYEGDRENDYYVHFAPTIKAARNRVVQLKTDGLYLKTLQDFLPQYHTTHYEITTKKKSSDQTQSAKVTGNAKVTKGMSGVESKKIEMVEAAVGKQVNDLEAMFQFATKDELELPTVSSPLLDVLFERVIKSEVLYMEGLTGSSLAMTMTDGVNTVAATRALHENTVTPALNRKSAKPKPNQSASTSGQQNANEA